MDAGLLTDSLRPLTGAFPRLPLRFLGHCVFRLNSVETETGQDQTENTLTEQRHYFAVGNNLLPV